MEQKILGWHLNGTPNESQPGLCFCTRPPRQHGGSGARSSQDRVTMAVMPTNAQLCDECACGLTRAPSQTHECFRAQSALAIGFHQQSPCGVSGTNGPAARPTTALSARKKKPTEGGCKCSRTTPTATTSAKKGVVRLARVELAISSLGGRCLL